MFLQYTVKSAYKCPQKHVVDALEIYSKKVDEGSITDTNQIKDYIFNFKNHSSDLRKMFFYLLYNGDNHVEGFAELAFLPKNKVAVIDYICTENRNNMQFYCFYHMIKQEMEDTLKKDSLFVRYYITELSLKQLDGKLLDYDSNYFRHILSNENYIKLPFPYYQPPLDTTGIMQSFNLAIHANVSENTDVPYIYKEKYLDIVTELYYAHYLEWYKNYYEYDSYKKIIDSILKKIKREIADNCKTEIISLVQCKLYDEGQCPKMSFENIGSITNSV